MKRLKIMFLGFFVFLIFVGLPQPQWLSGVSGRFSAIALQSPVDHFSPPYFTPLPFFPFGFYYVDYDRVDAAKTSPWLAGQKAAVQALAQAGFNTIHLAIYDDLEATEAVFDQAQALQLQIIGDYQSNLPRIEVLKRFQHHPALLGWNIGDDVNRNHTPQALNELQAQVKAEDPLHPTYISAFDPDPVVLQRYRDSADWMGMQSYPIPERSLTATFSEIHNAVTVAQTSVQNVAPVIANLQAFQWEKTALRPQTRAPTFAELRNMTYQAILAGAQGILYYTFRDPSWSLPDHPELWQGLQSLVPELKSFEPWLLSGPPDVYRLGESVLVGQWHLDTNQPDLLIVLNLANQPQTVSFQSLPIQPKTPLRTTLAPLAIQIYPLLP